VGINREYITLEKSLRSYSKLLQVNCFWDSRKRADDEHSQGRTLESGSWCVLQDHSWCKCVDGSAKLLDTWTLVSFVAKVYILFAAISDLAARAKICILVLGLRTEEWGATRHKFMFLALIQSPTSSSFWSNQITSYLLSPGPPAQCPHMLGKASIFPTPSFIYATSISESSGLMPMCQLSTVKST
jgi:hypothetical protein